MIISCYSIALLDCCYRRRASGVSKKAGSVPGIDKDELKLLNPLVWWLKTQGALELTAATSSHFQLFQSQSPGKERTTPEFRKTRELKDLIISRSSFTRAKKKFTEKQDARLDLLLSCVAHYIYLLLSKLFDDLVADVVVVS